MNFLTQQKHVELWDDELDVRLECVLEATFVEQTVGVGWIHAGSYGCVDEKEWVLSEWRVLVDGVDVVAALTPQMYHEAHGLAVDGQYESKNWEDV
jgi:hypothetical protein